MTLPVIILGAGGHAKVLIDTLLASSAVIAGIVDPIPALTGSTVLEVSVLGADNIVTEFPPAEVLLVNGLGSAGLPLRRQEIFARFKGMGYHFATVIHPSAVVAPDVKLGEGVQIMACSVIQPGSCIGCNTIINTRASVDHDCEIGDHVHIAPGVTVSGGVKVGDGTHIVVGATVLQGMEIAGHCLVAAGAVVVTNVTEGTTVKGIPARVSAR